MILLYILGGQHNYTTIEGFRAVRKSGNATIFVSKQMKITMVELCKIKL